MTLPDTALESLFDQLARAIDRAGPERDRLLLAKLALLMAADIGDETRVAALIREAESAVP